MRIHGLCKILRKMDILQEVLSFAHKRSLSKYSEIDHEEDFFETGDAPDIHRKWVFFEGVHLRRGFVAALRGLGKLHSEFVACCCDQSSLHGGGASQVGVGGSRGHIWHLPEQIPALRSLHPFLGSAMSRQQLPQLPDPSVCAFLSLPPAKTHQKPEIKSPNFSQVKVTDLFHRLVRTAMGWRSP